MPSYDSDHANSVRDKLWQANKLLCSLFNILHSCPHYSNSYRILKNKKTHHNILNHVIWCYMYVHCEALSSNYSKYIITHKHIRHINISQHVGQSLEPSSHARHSFLPMARWHASFSQGFSHGMHCEGGIWQSRCRNKHPQNGLNLSKTSQNIM